MLVAACGFQFPDQPGPPALRAQSQPLDYQKSTSLIFYISFGQYDGIYFQFKKKKKESKVKVFQMASEKHT